MPPLPSPAFGGQGSRVREFFTAERMVEETLAVYREALAQKS